MKSKLIPAWQINIGVALVVLLAGMYSYLTNPERPATALIAPFFGLMLLLTTDALRKEKKTAAHVVVVLTLLFGILTASMAFSSRKVDDPEKRARRVLVFSAMSLACLGASGYYVYGFLQRRKAAAQQPAA